MELQEVIKKLKLICSQEKLDISPNCILEQSVDIYLSKKISESQKDLQMMKKENIANYQKTKIVDSGATGKGIDRETKLDKQKGLRYD
jgi:hypothetical protein